MKNCVIGKWFLLLGGFCLLWSASELYAGQNFPTHVSVFGKSSPATVAPQKISPDKEADIRQLMTELGTRAVVAQAMSSMEANMRPLLLHALPPGQYREQLVELFFEKFHVKATPEAVINLVVPIYAQYLTDADVKGLIKFYKTPLGQKWISVRPKVQAILVPRANATGRQIGREAMREVLDEHPELAREFKAALKAARARGR